MSITAKIEFDVVLTKKFPKIMAHSKNRHIVLMETKTIGTILALGKDHSHPKLGRSEYIGFIYRDFVITEFEDFNDTVVLQND